MKEIIVYADESGTHDKTGQQAGSAYPIVAGFAASVSEWCKFRVEWMAVLNAHGAPYFHSRELRAAKAALEHNKEENAELRRNPFYGWPLHRLDRFLLTLAKLAGKRGKVMIAGALKLPIFHELRKRMPLGDDPYKYCISEFFRVFDHETRLRWGNFGAPVSFIFDRTTNLEWMNAVDEAFSVIKKKDQRMRGLIFADKKEPTHLPLQAADLLAYNIRRHVERLEIPPGGNLNLTPLDRALFDNLASAAVIKRALGQHSRTI